LGAYVQAPNCSYAWIAKCSNKDLRQVIGKINGVNNPLFTKLNIEHVSWDSVAKCVFHCYKPGTERNRQTTELFASLWRKLAHEYTDQNHVDEYNSMKHGFRIRSGGFAFAFGLEHEYGVPPPENEMKMIGHSEYGATFLKVEPIGSAKSNRSLRSKKTSINWSIERLIMLIQLVSMSIANVVSALRIANGAEAGSCQYLRPEEDSDFDKPWQYSPGVTSCNIDYVINENDVTSTTRKELLGIIGEQITK